MAEHITAQRSQRNPGDVPWWWLSGNTYPHRQLLKEQGARFSRKRRAWYFIGWELPAPVRQLLAPELETSTVPIEADDAPTLPDPTEIASSVNVSLERDQSLAVEPPDSVANNPDPGLTVSDETALPPDELPVVNAPAVRVIKPLSIPQDGGSPDAVQSALQQIKAVSSMPEPVSMLAGNRRLRQVPQSYCGELTGSITGQVFCYGYAIHDGVCVYVNMGGPRTSVEAIRAKLGKGDIVTLVPDDAPAIELTAGEGSSGMYTDYLQTIPEARFTSLILLHEWIVCPNDDAKPTFLLRVDDAQAKAKLKYLVTQLVNVPVFDVWTEFLWSAGSAASLVHPTRLAGGVDLLTISRDAAAWTRLIMGGVEQQIIQLPQTH